MKDFKKLIIWQNGMQLVSEIYKLSVFLPSSEKFGLTSQVTRAAVSIPSNIAEGSSRNSEKDYQRFLQIALGSAFELETQLLIAQELRLLPDPETTTVLRMIDTEQKMINGLMMKLNN